MDREHPPSTVTADAVASAKTDRAAVPEHRDVA
jgi:hypothetical protein